MAAPTFLNPIWDLTSLSTDEYNCIIPIFDNISFDWNLLRFGLYEQQRKFSIPILFEDLQVTLGSPIKSLLSNEFEKIESELDTKGIHLIALNEKDSDNTIRFFIYGVFYTNGKIVLDKTMSTNSDSAGKVFLLESAHAFDQFCLNNNERNAIWTAYLGHPPPTGETDWFWPDNYFRRIGESFMFGFANSISNYNLQDSDFIYPTTPNVINLTKNIIENKKMTIDSIFYPDTLVLKSNERAILEIDAVDEHRNPVEYRNIRVIQCDDGLNYKLYDQNKLLLSSDLYGQTLSLTLECNILINGKPLLERKPISVQVVPPKTQDISLKINKIGDEILLSPLIAPEWYLLRNGLFIWNLEDKSEMYYNISYERDNESNKNEIWILYEKSGQKISRDKGDITIKSYCQKNSQKSDIATMSIKL